MVLVVSGNFSESEITAYAELIDAAETTLGRSVAKGAVTTLTADLNRRLRVREMLVEDTRDTLSLPSDFLEAETVRIGTTTYTPIGAGYGHCHTYQVKDGQFQFSPEESEPELFLRYYAKLQVIGETQTNAVFERHPDLYLWGLLFNHARLVRDESGAAAWGPAYEQALADVRKDDVASRVGGRPMRVMPRSSA